MAAVLNPEMLTLVRDAKGWSQRDLAQQSGLSQAVVSKAENGLVDITDQKLSRLAETLDCPPALLTQATPQSASAMTCLHHRRRHSKLSAGATRRIESMTKLTRLSVEGILDGLDAEVGTDLTPMSGADPVKAAKALRASWALTGPITNMIALLESHGVVVVERSLGSRAQDAVSSWPADRVHPPVIVVNQGLPTDRLRFTLAHELAHLLLHLVPVEGQELEANRFAAEFLVPSQEIAAALTGLTTGDLRRLAEMKLTWRVSIGMLVQRAYDLGEISERQFREFRMRLSRLGWDVNEPGDLLGETPRLLDEVFALGRDEGLGDADLAALAFMTPESFARHYLRREVPRRRVRLNPADQVATQPVSTSDSQPSATRSDDTDTKGPASSTGQSPWDENKKESDE